MGSIADWLNAVRPGFDKFVTVFEDTGIDEYDDIAGIMGSALSSKVMAELEANLAQAGAKTAHIVKITTAMASMTSNACFTGS